MTAYKEMTPGERFEAVDQMATQLFGTKRWKTEFSRLYGLTPQALTKWTNNGAPVWACVALSDALRAQKWDKLCIDIITTENLIGPAGTAPLA